jgi:flagellar basal-body rod protein FlgB
MPISLMGQLRPGVPGGNVSCEWMRGRETAVRILDNLFGPHIDNVSKALSLASQRHSVLTANLANVNTPGYKRRDVDFNLSLSDAMGRQDSFARRRTSAASVRIDGNSVDLEKEVMAIAQTEIRYQALSDLAASYFSGIKNVIREGR